MSATLTPDDPRHGTINAYVNHRCRCEPCRAARRSYGIERGEITGTGKPRQGSQRPTGPDAARINAAATAAHIRSLLDAGASLTAIARSSGSAYGTIQALAAGTRGETKATAARLANLTIEQCRSAFTSPGAAIQPPGTWITEGACHGRTDLLDLFFPLPSTPRTTTDKATALCSNCPAIDACADYIAANPQQGVWAGTTEAERRQARRGAA